MFFAHLDQVAEGDSTSGRRLLRRDGFHAFFQFDPKLPLKLPDERVARADRAGLELRDDADPLVDLRAKIRLLPSPGLASLTDPLRKVVREFEFSGLRVHVPGGHPSLAHLQALGDDGGHRALPQRRRRDLVPEPRTVRANRQNGRVDGDVFQARHIGATQFADHESSPQRLNKKCWVYSLRLPALPPDDSMDDDQIREFSEKMSERIASLEDRNDKLLETARRAEGEKRYVETEMGRLQKEIRRLKQELDGPKNPPLIIGNIRDILADGRVGVKSSTGPDFIVNAADYITKENRVVGARVALNKQTLAVMGVLPPL